MIILKLFFLIALGVRERELGNKVKSGKRYSSKNKYQPISILLSLPKQYLDINQKSNYRHLHHKQFGVALLWNHNQ